jgi:hypothetical protein
VVRHIDQSLAAVADLDVDVRTQSEIIAVVDDYVIGFVVRSQRVAEFQEEAGDDRTAEWMDTIFNHMRRLIESGAYPDLQRAVEANRAAGGKDEDLGRMTSSEARFERGLELLLDGIEASYAKPVKRRRGR